MEDQGLNFGVMLSDLYRALEGIADPRQPSHAQRYRLRDLALGAWAAPVAAICTSIVNNGLRHGDVSRLRNVI